MNNVVDLRYMGEMFVTLIVIMDPPGTVPVFLALTAGHEARVRSRAAWQAVLVALSVIVVFALAGQQILSFLGISIASLQIAGGILLLLVALELLTGKTDSPDQVRDVNVALVPLGTPLLAGPGAIAATIVFTENASGTPEISAVAIAILAVHIVLLLALRFSSVLLHVLGRGGIIMLTRIAGLLLSAIAVQLVASGVRAYIESYVGLRA